MFSMMVLFVASIYHHGIPLSEGSCEFAADLQGTWQSRVQNQQIDRGVWKINDKELQGIKIDKTERNFTCDVKFDDGTYILEENKYEIIFGVVFRIFTCIEMYINDGQLQYKMRTPMTTDSNWYTRDLAVVYAVNKIPSRDAICNSKDVEKGILSRMSTRSVQRGSSNDMLRRFLDDEFRKYIKERRSTL